MNGELFQLCKIVIGAKKALRESTEIIFEPTKYEGSISFDLIPQKFLLRKKKYTVKGVDEWFKACKDKGVTDIKLLAPTNVKNPDLLGFANSSQSCILCFFGKSVTYFTPQWSFDSAEKKWNILYTERLWEEPPKEKPSYRDNTVPFKLILGQIGDLARKIDCGYFADIFQKAYDVLEGQEELEDLEYPYILFPKENVRLFKAAEISDVFGAMGSWNDSPPYMAKEKSLEKEYGVFSAELLKQMRTAVLYSVNEWR